MKAEVQIKGRLLPQSARDHVLLQKLFLQKVVAHAVRKVGVEEVHEAQARACKVTRLRLRCQQRLHDGVNNRLEVGGGVFGEGLEQILGLGHVLLTVVLKQRRGQILQQMLVLFLPVGEVSGLSCRQKRAVLP